MRKWTIGLADREHQGVKDIKLNLQTKWPKPVCVQVDDCCYWESQENQVLWRLGELVSYKDEEVENDALNC